MADCYRCTARGDCPRLFGDEDCLGYRDSGTLECDKCGRTIPASEAVEREDDGDVWRYCPACAKRMDCPAYIGCGSRTCEGCVYQERPATA